jgi:hypothetical protein
VSTRRDRRRGASRRRVGRRGIVVGAAVVVVVAGALVGVLLTRGDGGGSGGSARPAATTLPTTTTTVFIPTAPLTGRPDPSGLSQTRASLAVKIENSPDARPQSGLADADVVYEEVVEGGITRFWAVFNSKAPETVGPIRSVRLMDPGIVSPLGGIVVFSGGTADNVALIRRTPTVTVDENNAGPAFFRESARAAPHNLYGRTGLLWERGGTPIPPPAIFSFTAPGQTFAGTEAIDQFRVGFQAGYDPTYTWDPATRTWKRAYGALPFMDANGAQVAPTNVVVQFIGYPRGSEGVVVGSGEAWIFSDGRLLRGGWSKPDDATPTQFTDAFGGPVALTPGATWVELAPVSAPVDLVAAPPPPPTTLPPPTTTTTRPRSARR